MFDGVMIERCTRSIRDSRSLQCVAGAGLMSLKMHTVVEVCATAIRKKEERDGFKVIYYRGTKVEVGSRENLLGDLEMRCNDAYSRAFRRVLSEATVPYRSRHEKAEKPSHPATIHQSRPHAIVTCTVLTVSNSASTCSSSFLATSNKENRRLATNA